MKKKTKSRPLSEVAGLSKALEQRNEQAKLAQVAHDMARFFNSCPNPFAVQDFMACLAAGNLLTAELVHVTLLPHALLLHAVAPEPGVVDDVIRLTERLLEELEQKDRGPRYWHPDGYYAFALTSGTCDPNEIIDNPNTAYILDVYKALTNGVVKQAFKL